VLPDSIRAFGVEGSGNLLGGCYPNIDMKIDFCTLNGCPFNFPMNCPGTQTLAVGPNCTATLPSYSSLATFPPPPCPMTLDSVTQSPVLGSSAGTPGSAVTVSLFGHSGAFGASTCTFLVNVVDGTPPSVTCPANASVTLNGNCQVTLTSYVSQATATDNCAAAPTITQSPAAGTVLTGSGTTTVTLTATDAASNSSTCAFTLTRQETTPPTITCPPNATVALNGNCVAQLPDFMGTTTATDNCQPAPTLVQSPSAGSLLSGTGTTTVTLIATDGAGNTATCALTVTRQDQTPPTVQCPASITQSPVGLDCNPTVTWAAVTTTDNCGATLAGSHASGDAFPVGATTVTYTATDGAGNTASCSFVVTVLAPEITGTTNQFPSNACVGDVVTLTALSASSYAWSTGATTQSLQVTTTGWYWVDATGVPSCTARDSIYVNFAPLPQPVLSQVGNQVCTGSFASYQWLLNGNPIPGATGACTPLTTSGNYSVQVTDSLGCTGTGGPLGFVGLADKPLANAIAIYPNPAQNRLYVQVSQPITTAGRIVLYDIHGRAVLSQPFEQLDTRTELSLDGLADGSYFLQVQADGFWGMKKVVKLR
jgi:HYR domain/Secretion system C-terminal sorting domain